MFDLLCSLGYDNQIPVFLTLESSDLLQFNMMYTVTFVCFCFYMFINQGVTIKKSCLNKGYITYNHCHPS